MVTNTIGVGKHKLTHQMTGLIQSEYWMGFAYLTNRGMPVRV